MAKEKGLPPTKRMKIVAHIIFRLGKSLNELKIAKSSVVGDVINRFDSTSAVLHGSAMVSFPSGVTSLLEELVPKMLSFHCIIHLCSNFQAASYRRLWI